MGFSMACFTPLLNSINLLKMNIIVVVQQEELTVCQSPVVKLIGYDGNIMQKKLGESSVHLSGVRQLVLSLSLYIN